MPIEFTFVTASNGNSTTVIENSTKVTGNSTTGNGTSNSIAEDDIYWSMLEFERMGKGAKFVALTLIFFVWSTYCRARGTQLIDQS